VKPGYEMPAQIGDSVEHSELGVAHGEQEKMVCDPVFGQEQKKGNCVNFMVSTIDAPPRGQQVVEIVLHWLKSPLAVAPVFLKRVTSIDVLGFVYLISMFLYALFSETSDGRSQNTGWRSSTPASRKLISQQPDSCLIFSEE